MNPLRAVAARTPASFSALELPGRAVDQNGVVLDALIQPKLDKVEEQLLLYTQEMFGFGQLMFLLLAAAAAGAAESPNSSSLLVTNNDVPSPSSNTVTLFTLNEGGAPTAETVLLTGGSGVGGGFFAAARIIVVPTASTLCVFASDAAAAPDAASAPSDIAAIDANTKTLIGRFDALPTDSGLANGIGLASNSTYVYANFTSTSTIATFQLGSRCTLNFLGDVFAVGLNGGLVTGMATRANMMILSYGDGSIESFDISDGKPVSHGDAQLSAGAALDHFPGGIDITKDGHFAIFGDSSTVTTIETSDLSGEKLAPTTAYDLGQGWNSGNVRLSPDESLIYVTNDSGGTVSAAFFDATTGAVTSGCTSPTLRGYYSTWAYAGAARTQLATGSGGLLYVPEFGSSGMSSIGVLQVAVSGSTCTLNETATSPIVDDKDPSYLLSLDVYPGRSY